MPATAPMPDAAAEVAPQDAPECAAEVVPEVLPDEELAKVTSAEATELALTQPQRLAIVSLRKCPSRIKAAAAAHVTRQTLWRWIKQDPAFQAAFNAWQQDLLDTGKGEILAGTRDAIQTVLTAIRNGDAKLAWKLLESQGLTKPPQPGPTDVQAIAELQATEKRIETVKRKRIKAKLDMAESMADLQSLA